MTSILILCLILAGAILLFVTEWVRPDLVALLVLGALVLTRILKPEEAILGFSNPATVTVGCMLVLSAALDRSGALAPVSDAILKVGGGRPLLTAGLLIVTVGVLSAFVNNTAVVAVFLPAVTAIAHSEKISLSKLLIPMSFGLGPIEMFEPTRLGAVLFGAGVVLMLAVGYWMLVPRHVPGEAIDEYHLREYLAEAEVQPESPLIGRSLHDVATEKDLQVDVIGILRKGRRIMAPPAYNVIRAGDVLLVEGHVKHLLEVRETEGIDLKGDQVLHDADLASEEISLFEALVAPGSRLEGRTLSGFNFRRRTGLTPLAIQRTGETLREKIERVTLRVGDALLLQGAPSDIESLKAGANLLVLGPIGVRVPRRNKRPAAILIMAGVVAAAAAGFPIVGAAILGAVLMIVTRCLTLEEAYQSIDWKVLFLLAGVLPLGYAMTTTGAADLIARNVLLPVGSFGPIAALAVLYILTTLLTEVMSNNSAAAVLAPIGIATAYALGVDPRPFLMTVCFAGSTSFLTPIGYQTNTMVYGPGAYRFWDFARAGWPLNVAFFILSVIFIPRIWPF
jgi:di/tricarboxylate transporter